MDTFNKQFETQGNKILCKVNNNIIFVINRPFTNNKCRFVNDTITLNSSYSDTINNLHYSDNFSYIKKIEDNRYLFSTGGGEGNYIEFYLNNEEFENFKNCIWKSEDEMTYYFDSILYAVQKPQEHIKIFKNYKEAETYAKDIYKMTGVNIKPIKLEENTIIETIMDY